MILEMRTHFAYCANVIPINPYMSPSTTLSKYKRDLVVALCKYISHQPKPPMRDLNTLLSAANNFILDSQVSVAAAALVSLPQNALHRNPLPLVRESTSNPESPKPTPDDNPKRRSRHEPHSETKTASKNSQSLDLQFVSAVSVDPCSFPHDPTLADSTTNCSNQSHGNKVQTSESMELIEPSPPQGHLLSLTSFSSQFFNLPSDEKLMNSFEIIDNVNDEN
jgi:hypothetical protein